MRLRGSICALGVALAAAVGAQAASGATLTADYQFQDGFSSSVGGAGDMQPVGNGSKFATETVGCSPQRVLTFPKAAGVQVANPNGESGNYSIVVDFRLSDLSGYRRIMAPGPSGPTFNTDDGLYERNSFLAIYDGLQGGNPHLGSTAALQPNTYAEVALAYSGQKSTLVPGYVNGDENLTSYETGDSGAMLAAWMRFFKDNDTNGATTEDSAGAVARIRIYHGVLSPSEVQAIYNQGPLAGACNPLQRARAAIDGRVKVKRRHGVFVVLTGIDASCPTGGGECSGSAAVTKGGGSGRAATASRLPKKLGKSKLSVAAGATKAVKVKLTRKASQALSKKGKLKAKISVSLSPPGGTAAVASRTAKLKLPKHK